MIVAHQNTSHQTAPRHFLDLDVLPREELREILDLGTAFKSGKPPAGEAKPLVGKAMAMIFEMVSSRFIFAVSQLQPVLQLQMIRFNDAHGNKKVGFRPLLAFDR